MKALIFYADINLFFFFFEKVHVIDSAAEYHTQHQKRKTYKKKTAPHQTCLDEMNSMRSTKKPACMLPYLYFWFSLGWNTNINISNLCISSVFCFSFLFFVFCWVFFLFFVVVVFSFLFIEIWEFVVRKECCLRPPESVIHSKNNSMLIF